MKLAWCRNRQPGGVLKSGSPALAKFVALTVARAAEAVRDDVAERRPERLLDRRIGPLDLALVPLLVDVGAGLAQDDVLDPVGARPAGRGAGLDAQAPRRLGLALVGRDVASAGRPTSRAASCRCQSRTFGSNQIRPLTAVLMKTPTCLPLTCAEVDQGGRGLGLCRSARRARRRGRRGCRPTAAIWPGPGRPARSGRTPDATPVVRTVLRSRVPVYFTFAPVCCLPRRDHRVEGLLLVATPGADDGHGLAGQVSATGRWCGAAAARACRRACWPHRCWPPGSATRCPMNRQPPPVPRRR